MTACVRVPDAAGRRVPQVGGVSDNGQGLLALHDWLAAHGVTHVAMEATGVYWKPVWHMLEDDFELMLGNARHVKKVPGRKTDVCDAQWLRQLMEAGLLQRQLRAAQAAAGAADPDALSQDADRRAEREANRLQKALEDTSIKLDCVATDILGVSGRAMLDALVAGTTDRRCWPNSPGAGCVRRSPRCASPRGPLRGPSRLVIGAILAHLDFLDEQIERLVSDRGARALRAAGVALPHEPGVASRTAEVMVAEIGTDMTVFPTAATSPPGPAVPRQRPVRRQTPLRPHPQRPQVARDRARRGRAGRDPHQEQLPRRNTNDSSPGRHTAAPSAPSSTRC